MEQEFSQRLPVTDFSPSAYIQCEIVYTRRTVLQAEGVFFLRLFATLNPTLAHYRVYVCFQSVEIRCNKMHFSFSRALFFLRCFLCLPSV